MLADAICMEREKPLLLVNAKALMKDESFETLDVILREALLQNSYIYIEGIDALWKEKDGINVTNLIHELDLFPNWIFLSGEKQWEPPGVLENHRFMSIPFQIPSFTLRKKLWESFLDGNSDGVDISAIATKFKFSAGQIATTARELPEIAQQRANRPGGVGRWQQVAAQDPAGGMHRMVLGRDVLAGVIAASNIGGVSYTGPAYGGRMSPAQFIQNNQALLNPLGDAVLAARLDLVSAISVNEGFLDAIRLRDRGVVSAGLQQSSAHVEIELPSLMYRFKTASPDLFMLYFGIYGLDVEPNGVDGNNNPRYRFVQVQPNGNRVPLVTWNQILTFFGGAGGPAAYSFLTDWAARFREAAIASPEFSVAQLLEAASRLDRILREVPILNVPTVGPVDLNTLITSEFGVALILDSHINQPGRVPGDLQIATTAAGHNVDPNVQERDIMIHYEPNRHTFDTPARNANINAIGLDHAHGSFAGW
ncbi:MAG: hypothetical protein Q8M95_05425 [Candidatus Methanoperedens sp.]|nr:hypothetical protein [Candidatus Methanoperedens sp.]